MVEAIKDRLTETEVVIKIPVLTRDQEFRLFHARKFGISLKLTLASHVFGDKFKRSCRQVTDIDDLLVRANEGLVAHAALKYGDKSVDSDDLKQAGYLGLLRAIDTFDYQKGYKFSTYAVWWIRKTVGEENSRFTEGIYIPRHQVLRNRCVLRATDNMTDIGDCQTIASKTELTPAQVKFTLALLSSGILKTVSLDVPIKNGDSATRGQTVSSPDDSELERFFLRDQFKSMFEILTPKERRVLTLRYGLTDNSEKFLREIARELEITVWSVVTTEKEALDKLREFLRV